MKNHKHRLLPFLLIWMLSGYGVASGQSTGTIIGKVTLDGHAVSSEKMVVSGKGGIMNAILTVIDAEGVFKADPVLIDQKDKQFRERISVTMIGSTVTFRNEDSVMHNVHTYQNGRTGFNLAMPRLHQITKKRIRRPGMMEVKCDVHPDMKAFMLVTDNPFYAKSNSAGIFKIEGVPTGTYTIRAWHEVLGTLESRVTIEAGKTVPVVFEFHPTATP